MSDDDDLLPKTPDGDGPTYPEYLRVKELLALQSPLSEPPHHDEFLFIVIHQVYELWFLQILHELDAVGRALDEDRALVCYKILRRVTAIQRVLIAQLSVLETMTPQDFAEFRTRLNPASGFQSSQFREMEFLAGLKDPRYLRFHKNSPDIYARLERRLAEPSLYDRLCGHLARRGFDVPETAPVEGSPDSTRLINAIRDLYEGSEQWFDLYLLCEHLVEFDELLQLWRFAHVKMVERTIGGKRGTGGSSGAKYLRSTIDKRFFPELWDARDVIGT